MLPSCNNLANRMNASSELTPFMSRSMVPGSFRLPYKELDPCKLPVSPFKSELTVCWIVGGGCELGVSFDSKMRYPVQYSSWYTIWQAVVAINAMCIRNGQRGRWLSIGYTIGTCADRISVSMLNALRRPSR